MRSGSWITLTCVSLLLAGCGGSGGDSTPTGTVTGKVSLNGKPLEGGMIVFVAQGKSSNASGTVLKDGTYTLKHGKGFSVPVGDYRIYVSSVDVSAPTPDPMDLNNNPEKYEQKNTIPEKFQSAETSGLVAVVKAGSNPNTDFDLK